MRAGRWEDGSGSDVRKSVADAVAAQAIPLHTGGQQRRGRETSEEMTGLLAAEARPPRETRDAGSLFLPAFVLSSAPAGGRPRTGDGRLMGVWLLFLAEELQASGEPEEDSPADEQPEREPAPSAWVQSTTCLPRLDSAVLAFTL